MKRCGWDNSCRFIRNGDDSRVVGLAAPHTAMSTMNTAQYLSDGTAGLRSCSTVCDPEQSSPLSINSLVPVVAASQANLVYSLQPLWSTFFAVVLLKVRHFNAGLLRTLSSCLVVKLARSSSTTHLSR